MIKNREYLTDTELESFIRKLEQNELVCAPPDMQSEILEKLEQEIWEAEEREKREKITAYKRYRFRVLTTVAAAVLVVFLYPRFESRKLPEVDFIKPLQRQEEVSPGRYVSKEEALSDSGMLETLFGGVNIFADNSRFNLFRE
ncbi:MAG: hypothetical protein IJP31_03145 [Lachnospiraceae bacterium]|nr:hypothetical protein [Lachnospiraceae bacterium]